MRLRYRRLVYSRYEHELTDITAALDMTISRRSFRKGE
jgi:hypothetical protein